MSLNNIAILDYKSGNLRSIHNGFKKIGRRVTVTSDRKDLKKADAIILPGVGAFGAAMKNLVNYRDIILEHTDDKKPLLGICLGLQVMFTGSEENPGTEGLNLFKGTVKKFNLPREYKIPHMGWNQIKISKTPENNTGILEGCDDKYMYFVHSYYIKPEDESIITAYTGYSDDIPAAIGKDNIHALQFHPEKSGEYGLKILEKFTQTI